MTNQHTPFTVKRLNIHAINADTLQSNVYALQQGSYLHDNEAVAATIKFPVWSVDVQFAIVGFETMAYRLRMLDVEGEMKSVTKWCVLGRISDAADRAKLCKTIWNRYIGLVA